MNTSAAQDISFPLPPVVLREAWVQARKTLLAALEKGAKDNDGTVARCFDPRHGIRVKAGDKTIDLVICFACYQTKVFTGDKLSGDYLTTDSPQPALNRVLKDANVPLPKGKN